MSKIMKLPDGTTYEREDFVEVVSTSARNAIEFFGFNPGIARAVDMGPPKHDLHRYKSNARLWRVYKSAGDMPS